MEVLVENIFVIISKTFELLNERLERHLGEFVVQLKMKQILSDIYVKSPFIAHFQINIYNINQNTCLTVHQITSKKNIKVAKANPIPNR